MSTRTFLAAALASLLAACGSSSTSTTTARMNVRLVDAPTTDYKQVNVDVQTVQILNGTDWITLGSPNKVVDLLSLTNGVYETLVDGATLPAGQYGQMRLILGSRNTVVLPDDTVKDLTVPSGQQSGIKMTVNFDVKEGTTADVFIDFDAHRSIFVHQAGASGKYILRPTVRAYDKLVTGSISGTLLGTGNAALAGVTVTAQTSGTGGPSVARSTFTDANGHYVLDLLPMKDAGGADITYYGVSQPVIRDGSGNATASYVAQASPGIVLTQTAPTATWNATFATAAATGTIAGSITPVATEAQGDTVEILQDLATGSGSTTLLVRSVAAAVTGTPATETYAVDALPTAADPAATTYGVVGIRRTVDTSGNETFSTSNPIAPVAVPAGGTATANLTFP